MRSEGEGLAGLSPFFRARRRWSFLALLMPVPRSFIHFARFSASIRPSYAFPTLVRSYYAFGGPWMRISGERMKAARQMDEWMGRAADAAATEHPLLRVALQRAPISTCRKRPAPAFTRRIPLSTRLYVLGGHLARKSGCSMFGRVETGAEWESVLMVTRNTGREAHNLLAWKPRK